MNFEFMNSKYQNEMEEFECANEVIAFKISKCNGEIQNGKNACKKKGEIVLYTPIGIREPGMGAS